VKFSLSRACLLVLAGLIASFLAIAPAQAVRIDVGPLGVGVETNGLTIAQMERWVGVLDAMELNELAERFRFVIADRKVQLQRLKAEAALPQAAFRLSAQNGVVRLQRVRNRPEPPRTTWYLPRPESNPNLPSPPELEPMPPVAEPEDSGKANSQVPDPQRGYADRPERLETRSHESSESEDEMDADDEWKVRSRKRDRSKSAKTNTSQNGRPAPAAKGNRKASRRTRAPHIRWTDEVQKRAEAYQKAGMSQGLIARELGAHVSTVRAHLKPKAAAPVAGQADDLEASPPAPGVEKPSVSNRRSDGETSP
jgi:hypothetical protein